MAANQYCTPIGFVGHIWDCEVLYEKEEICQFLDELIKFTYK